jgi:hypothetical protein
MAQVSPIENSQLVPNYSSYVGNRARRESTVSNNCMRFFTVLAVVLFLAGECFPKVAPTTLQKLTSSADLIVIGKVTKLLNVKDLRVAEVQVAKTLKGPPHPTIHYLAQPTWICDTTGATVGEETLFFFNKYRFDPEPASMAFVRPGGSAGTYTVEDDVSSVRVFKEPTGFREQVAALVGSSSFWQVSWEGRGQMPVRDLHGTKYVTLWVGDVLLPTGMRTISGPKREYSSFIRSVPLSAMLDFVQQQANAGAQKVRYFKAEHGVGATYVELRADGRYKVIDREHMGIFLTDEGRWQQTGAMITFSPAALKRTSYQATENSHKGKVFLAITSADAAAGIVFPAEDTKKDLDANPNHLPYHVFFKITAKTYNTETKEYYPFRYIGEETLMHVGWLPGEKSATTPPVWGTRAWSASVRSAILNWCNRPKYNSKRAVRFRAAMADAVSWLIFVLQNRVRVSCTPKVCVPPVFCIAYLQLALTDHFVIGVLRNKSVLSFFPGLPTAARPAKRYRILAIITERHDLKAKRLIAIFFPESDKVLRGVRFT